MLTMKPNTNDEHKLEKLDSNCVPEQFNDCFSCRIAMIEQGYAKALDDVEKILKEMTKKYKTKDCISDCCKSCRVCITNYLIAKLSHSQQDTSRTTKTQNETADTHIPKLAKESK